MTDNNETFIMDINNPQEQLISYGKQQIGFYDGYKAGKPALYIYIRNNNDKFTVVKRRAGEKRVMINGDLQPVEETKLYARAYDKYLKIKEAGGIVDKEKEALRIKIAELEAKAAKKEKKASKSKSETTNVAELEAKALKKESK